MQYVFAAPANSLNAMAPTQLLGDVFVVLLAVALVPLVQCCRVSTVVGYVVAGAVIGPHGFALIDESHGAVGLAELGIVFLLFTLGLELSFERLRTMRRHIFGLGAAQVVVSATVIGAIAWWLGLTPAAAVIVGAALALSSTAVVLQVLNDQRDIIARPGRISFAVLLFQDLSVAPMLALIPLLAAHTGSIAVPMLAAVAKAVVAVAAIMALGRLVTQPLFRLAAKSGSREMFVALMLLVALGTGWLTYEAGLSMALGAFLAGLVLGGTIYRHQVEADIEPFKGILLGLFFMTVGMMIDPVMIVQRAGLIAVIVAAMLALKGGLAAGLCRGFGVGWPKALRIGLLLAAGGEFAFVILELALAEGMVPPVETQILIVAVAITMALTPTLGAAGKTLQRRFETRVADRHNGLHEEAADLNNHVIIAGFGRVGQTVGNLLARLHIPFIALDLDPGLVAAARRHGSTVFYGNADHLDVLLTAGVARARAVVITVDQPSMAESIVEMLRHHFPDLEILVRAHDFAQGLELERAGATHAVPELLEASLELGRDVLAAVGAPLDDVTRIIRQVREHHYDGLEGVIPPGGAHHGAHWGGHGGGHWGRWGHSGH